MILINYIYINDRFVLEFDNGKKTKISYEKFNELNLSKNIPISNEMYTVLINEDNFENAKSKIFNYINFKLRTKKEIYNKLISYKINEEQIKEIMDFLERNEVYNDKLYAKSYINDMLELKKWSIKKIKYELIRKGIDEYLLEDIFYEMNINDDIEFQNALYLIKNKYKNMDFSNLEYKDKNKIYNYLSYRGFSYDTISSVIEAL